MPSLANAMGDITNVYAGGGTPSSSSKVVEIAPELIQEHRDNVLSDDPARQLSSTQHFRRLLSIEKNPPIQQVIDSGVVARFVQFLQMNENPVNKLKYICISYFLIIQNIFLGSSI